MKKITVNDYIALSVAVKDARNALMDISTDYIDTIGKKDGYAIFCMITKLNKLVSKWEEEMFANNPELSGKQEALNIFYGS